MLSFPDIDPVAMQVGPLKVHWYGVMYLVGFAQAWWLARIRSRGGNDWNHQAISDLVFYCAMGAVIGGRLGYVIFYDLVNYLDHPLNIFKVWQGGMSFHGGLAGVIVAMYWFSRKNGRSFWEVCDFTAPLVPLGLCAGRIGNFINGELWGRVTDVSWAMVFPKADGFPRHPSQLYEAMLEGMVLFVIVWLFSGKARPAGSVSAVFLIMYGLFRFLVEFTRMPDSHLGFIAFGWLTMGQVLSLPMALAGLFLLNYSWRHQGRGIAR